MTSAPTHDVEREERPCTTAQDERVLLLVLKKRMPRKEVATILNLSYHQVAHAFRRWRDKRWAKRAVRSA